MKGLNVIAEKCIGCRICEQWCIWRHENEGGTGSRIKVARLHANYVNLPHVCRQCEDTPCIKSCRFQALDRDPGTGAILVNRERCTGCRLCQRKCPHGAINFDKRTKKVLICDLCGGNPACVVHCPEEALLTSNSAYNRPGREKSECSNSTSGLWSWREVKENE